MVENQYSLQTAVKASVSTKVGWWPRGTDFSIKLGQRQRYMYNSMHGHEHTGACHIKHASEVYTYMRFQSLLPHYYLRPNKS